MRTHSKFNSPISPANLNYSHRVPSTARVIRPIDILSSAIFNVRYRRDSGAQFGHGTPISNTLAPRNDNAVGSPFRYQRHRLMINENATRMRANNGALANLTAFSRGLVRASRVPRLSVSYRDLRARGHSKASWYARVLSP